MFSSDERYWLVIWAMLLTAFLAILATCTIVSYSADARIERLSKEGHNPIAVACAINWFSHDAARVAVCLEVVRAIERP